MINRINLPSNLKSIIALIRNISFMGSCASRVIESTLIPYKDGYTEHQVKAEAGDPEMGERSDYNDFLETYNRLLSMATETYRRCDDLSNSYSEIQKQNEQLTADNEFLRQRMSNDSEMKHRSHQSSSEDARSRNKRSDVLQKFKKMDGVTRRQAIEALWKPSVRTELWYRKDLTCRILLTAYELAEKAKERFNHHVLPMIFQCAPSLGVLPEEKLSQPCPRISQQRISEEMRHLLSAESFKVACSSVLKEMAANCDLTDLEEKTLEELKNCLDQWREQHPWLPHLDDNSLGNDKLKNYVKECVRISWRMVNLLPPLKIVTADHLQGRAIDDFFDTEVEENKEQARTMSVCVWPAVIDSANPAGVLVKGIMVILPKPKNKKLCNV